MIKTNNISTNKENGKLTPASKENQNKWAGFWSASNSVPSPYRYNLSICDKPKFIWYRNAKVGTRSTFSVFEDVGLEFVAGSPFNCHYPPQVYKDYFKFAFVRNPWDRFVSGWLNKVIRTNSLGIAPNLHKELKEFDRFVAYCSEFDLDTWNSHFRKQSRLIDLNEVNFIGRLENFNDDLRQIFKILNLPLDQIPNMNRTPNRDNYRSYYTENSKRLIEKMYQKDIQLFGYTF